MGLDIRIPIGLMFSIMGVLLAGFGLMSDAAIYERSLGLNVNLIWGIVLMAFGGVMLGLGYRASGAARPAEHTPAQPAVAVAPTPPEAAEDER